MVKVSVILTIKDAEHELPELFVSLEQQTHQPDEVIITDASIHERCSRLVRSWKPSFPVHYFHVSGNRSAGRNKAIAQTQYAIIAITDAGCVPEKHWLERLVKPFLNPQVQIVSGFTLPRARTVWQEVGGAYFLVMPERIGNNYLPATRSMAMRKEVWTSLGKFPENLDLSEDYAFAKLAQGKNVNMRFVPDAIVEWTPPGSLVEIGQTVYALALWDVMGGVVRWKTLSIFVRYIILLVAFAWSWMIGFGLFFCYCLWSWFKNHSYVRRPISFLVLPIAQIYTDFQVMLATSKGFLIKRKHKAYSRIDDAKY